MGEARGSGSELGGEGGARGNLFDRSLERSVSSLQRKIGSGCCAAGPKHCRQWLKTQDDPTRTSQSWAGRQRCWRKIATLPRRCGDFSGMPAHRRPSLTDMSKKLKETNPKVECAGGQQQREAVERQAVQHLHARVFCNELSRGLCLASHPGPQTC